MKKNFVIIALLIALISVTIYLFPSGITKEAAKKLSFNSMVCIYKNDEQIGECTHNTMENVGLNWTRDLIGAGTAAGVMNVIAVGNGSTAESATLTDLNGRIAECGLTQAAGSYTNQLISVGNWSISKVFTTTGCAGIVVNTTGLFNSTTISGATVMFAGKNFSNSVTLQTGDQLNVTWFIWVS